MSPLILLVIGLIVVLGGILVVKLHPILALLLGAVIVGFLTSDQDLQQYAVSKGLSEVQTKNLLGQQLGTRIAIAFGDTCEKIGLLIVFASIIGKCMLDSGAAERIVRSMLRIFGEKKAPASFMVSGFVLAIPIFFDTVFYLMVPLARAMGIRNEKSYALYIMAIVAGGTMAHSLVPPTPGPLFAAGAFGVSVGMMIIMGTLVGLVASGAGLAYGFWLNKRQHIPLRTTSDTSVEELKTWLNKDTAQLPSFFMANLPIALPVILIAGNTIIKSLTIAVPSEIRSFFQVTGDPVIALLFATITALFVLSKQTSFKVRELKKPVEEAIFSAGPIILITASGGAFGAMLQQTSIGTWLMNISGDYKLALLPLAWFIAAVMRTAQGSATVSIITAVGMLTVFNTPGALSFHPVYLAVVIGCGSKLFPWMNDSGFWIICKMSGFTEGETIRNFSLLLTVMGVAGLAFTMLLAKIFPLI
ncbi:MAG TPA: GntP family permease [Cyclobacteriaceae bacterium]|nr:GntP family permease [Cyclobacteriaceae bacterium]